MTALLVLAGGFAISACSGPDASAPDLIVKFTETDTQSAPAGARLPVSLAVKVLSKDGTLLPRIRVRWTLLAGYGTLSDSVTVTDGTGRAQVDWTLPSGTGTYVASAILVPVPSRMVTFTAAATAPAQITALSPSSFKGGDAVTLTGTGFTSSAQVEMSGAPARVTSASATTLNVVAPLCLAPGTVPVRARVSGAYSNSMNATYVGSSAAVTLAPGDYALIDPGQLAAGCATFPTAGLLGAEYLLAPQSVNGTAGTSVAYRLAGDSTVTLTVASLPDEAPETAADAFHRFLRESEREISLQPNRPGPVITTPAAAAEAAATTIKVGDSKTFKVCNKFGCNLPADFTRITTLVKYVGDHMVIVQDVAAPAGGFTDDEYKVLGDGADQVLYDIDTRAYGVESDVDQNARVFIVFSPVVNGITPRDQCSTSVITGFFYGIDIDPAYANDTRANQAEVFNALTPDPSGTVSCAVTKAQVQRVVPSTFIHEFQHMINYNQHVLVRAAAAEETWLNEAMSHLAEELGGNAYRDKGQQQTYSDFVIGDVFNAYQYLKTPGSYYVLFESGAGSLAERGGEWLFLRWLVDRFGVGTMRRMEETRLLGAENISSAVGEPITRLLGEWFLANWVSDLPNFTPPQRLKYETWAFRTTYASLNQQQPSRYDRPFPLVPQVFNGGTFTANATARAGSGDYFRVVQSTNQRGFGIRLTDQSGLPLPTNAAIRLNVIRIR